MVFILSTKSNGYQLRLTMSQHQRLRKPRFNCIWSHLSVSPFISVCIDLFNVFWTSLRFIMMNSIYPRAFQPLLAGLSIGTVVLVFNLVLLFLAKVFSRHALHSYYSWSLLGEEVDKNNKSKSECCPQQVVSFFFLLLRDTSAKAWLCREP